MPARGNQKGLDCPFCGEPASTLFVSQFPQAKAVGTEIIVVLPHDLAVCAGCYFAQFVRRYWPECLDLAMTRGAEVRNQARYILRRHPETEGRDEALELLVVSEQADLAATADAPEEEPEEPEEEPVVPEGAGKVEVAGAELG